MSRSPHSIKMKNYTQIILLFQEDSLSKFDVRQKPLECWCWVGMCQKADIQVITLGEDFSPNLFSPLFNSGDWPPEIIDLSPESLSMLCYSALPPGLPHQAENTSVAVIKTFPFLPHWGNATPKAQWGCFCPSNMTVLILDLSCY